MSQNVDNSSSNLLRRISPFLKLLDVLDKRLLMHEAGVVTIPQDTNVP